jgi:membrane protein insertase Oxa1/YidC/SpoIIIJ
MFISQSGFYRYLCGMGWLIKWMLIISIIYYILNKLVFPVFRFTMFNNDKMRQMQDRMREMEEKMNQSQQGQRRTGTRKDNDYIDYEEVK